MKGALGTMLDALATALDGDDGRLPGDPATLELAFAVELRRILRAGPEADGASPRRLIELAQRAAAAGAVGIACPAGLRRALARLAARLHAAGAWDPARPLWYEPLPSASALEQLWKELGEPRIADDPKTRVAFERHRRLCLPDLLPAPFLERLHLELEAAQEDGALGLEREGVGRTGRLSARRSDRVVYLTGHEPELLRRAPAAAALVQHGLRRLGEELGALLGSLHPPRRAMLACYEGPSRGYDAHLDNPGGGDDNGRAATVVLYLNRPETRCEGGELALWEARAGTGEPPAEVVPARGGTTAVFDSRLVAHRVQPLAPGPARWALTLWLNDAPQTPPGPPAPAAMVTDALLPIAAPPLVPGTVLFHELDARSPGGRLSVHRAPPSRPRLGIVATVYRAGGDLETWCAHHFGLGADHLVLVFDHPDEPAEAAAWRRLRKLHPPERLTLWRGPEVAAERWATLLEEEEAARLARVARGGASNHAVAARQTLHASAALVAAKRGETGAAPLDWLLHLDADELLWLEGSARGGETLEEHLRAAAAAGWDLLRYANHELLAPWRPGEVPRFKRNPHLAAALLGPVGFARLVEHLTMAQSDPRPYFTGYFNGKAAVAVAAGRAAAGVHGWRLEGSRQGAASPLLAGPSVLHFHLASAKSFVEKYAAVARAPLAEAPLFAPSPIETAARERVAELEAAGADAAEIARRLAQLHAERTRFSDRDVELLEAAGLLIRPRLERRLRGG